VWDAFVTVIEAFELYVDEAEARHIGVFCGRSAQGLQTDTDAKEGLAGADVREDGLGVGCGGELGETVAEVADAGDDDGLGAVRGCNAKWSGFEERERRHTSAEAMSEGCFIQETVQPSFSMALTRERMLPAT